MQPVRCRDCGYLAIREFANRELVEAEACVRKDGAMPPTIPHAHRKYELIPLCFAGAMDFSTEMQIAAGADDPRKIVSVCSDERTCESFTTWQIGHSPKEHRKMDMLKEQREANERFLLTLQEGNRTANESIAAKGRVTLLICAGIGIGAALAGAAMAWMMSSVVK
jgi:hypothetical protein